MIGIIGAMDIEVELLTARMSGKEVLNFAGRSYFKGFIGGTECVVASSGEGKVNSAVCTQVMIDRFSPSLIINTGVAGGIGDGVEIGDVVFASATVEHDYDVTALGKEAGFVFGTNRVYIDTHKESTAALLDIAGKKGLKTHLGIIASGDKFISSEEDRQRIRTLFGAKACEMEGAAIGHVCCLNSVPFAVIRAISDNGNDDAKVDFPTFVGQAVPKTVAVLDEFLGCCDK